MTKGMIEAIQALTKAAFECRSENFYVQVSLFPKFEEMPVNVGFHINGELDAPLTDSPYRPTPSDIKQIVLKIERLYRASLAK